MVGILRKDFCNFLFYCIFILISNEVKPVPLIFTFVVVRIGPPYFDFHIHTLLARLQTDFPTFYFVQDISNRFN